MRAVEMSYLRGACGVSIQMGWAEQRECVREVWHERAWKWDRVRCGGIGEKEVP